MKHTPFLYSLCIALFVSACATTPKSLEADYVFDHVNVVPLNKEVVLSDHKVVVRNNQIIAILDSSSAVKITAKHRIDGAGRYLLPGLADMHVHMRMDPTAMFNLMLANGVTTVSNMRLNDGEGAIDHLQLRRDVSTGEMIGPRYLVSGPQLKPYMLPNMEAVETIFDEHVKQGYDVVKIHENLKPSIYNAIIDGAKERELRVTGHFQHTEPLATSLNQSSVEHVEEFLYTTLEGMPKFPEGEFTDWPTYYEHTKNMANAEYRAPIVKAVAESGIYVNPTLIIYNSIYDWIDDETFSQLALNENLVYLPKNTYDTYLNPKTNDYRRPGFPFTSDHIKSNVEVLKSMVYDLQQAGVPLLLGSDAFGTVVPGFSLHDELALIVSAGISPYNALRMGTVNVASYLGESNTAGTIEKGKRADFILLEENPLTDIRHTRNVEGVFTHGLWHSKSELKKMLLDAKAIANQAN